MYRLHILITCMVLLLLLAACGQKGPLFLPDPQPVDTRQESGDQDDEEEARKT